LQEIAIQNNTGVDFPGNALVTSSKIEMNSEAICVVPAGDRCGEGVIWHETHASVYWNDINRFLIHRFTPSSNSVRSWFFDEPVTALSLTSADNILAVVLGSGVILWEPETDSRLAPIFVLEGWPRVRLNDGGADPRGSFWVGSMRNNVKPDGSLGEAGGQDGMLYRIDPDGRTSVHRRNIGISNTLAWSPDRLSFYSGDTLANVIWTYDYDPKTGDIANERPFLKDFSRGLPDGSSVDSEGFLWNCRFFGGCIVRVAPDGKIDRVVEMPVKNVTTCTFGGSDLRTLYITTASNDAAVGDRLAGGLFALRTDAAGQPENHYSLRGKE
jgi:sugar lactone lactonase YvrE